MQESRFLPSTARRARMAVALAAACASVAVAAPTAFAGAVISNGTVALGVNNAGDLNFADTSRYVGVTYEPTGFDGTKDGCPCEGWGAGWTDGGGQHFGKADEAQGGPTNLNVAPFASTATTATSTTDIEGALKITQEFKPAATTPNLYEIHVTLENISGAALPDVRYTRLMDWDIEPTPFNEFVTIQGVSPKPDALLHSDDNGFADASPFGSRGELSPGTTDANVTDSGPNDHGALFDFGFGTIDVGKKVEFSIFYGATADEATANAVVSAAALEIYSYGQSNTAGGPTLGTPTTFIWGFKAVGGKPVIPPTLTLSPKTATNTVGDPHTVTAELKDSGGAAVPGAKLVFEVSGVNSPPKGTATTGADGKATFTYTGTNAGGDTIKACLDNNDNGSCDADEVTDTATKTWVAKSVAPAIALSPKTATNTVGDPHTVTATVTDTNAGGAAINGAKVVFVVTGVNPQAAVSKTTDATGKATDTWTGSNVGNDTVTACVDTNSNGACDTGEPTDTAAKTWVAKTPPADRDAPSCVLANTGTDSKGKKYIEIAVQDTGSGLKSVVVNKTINADTPVPPFAVGSTAKLTIRSTKKDQTKSSTVELTVTDVAGNVTVCDPVIARVKGGKAGAFVKTFRRIPAKEHYLRVTNGKPGLRSIHVTVNGKTVLRGRLDSGERQTLDIAKYMRPGRKNTVVVRSRGGSDALVVISD